MAKMYYESDADMSLVDSKTFGIIGYGSQGHAHALNLHDNGLDVMVGLYEGSSSIAKAEADGLKVGMVAEVAEQSDIIMMLIPDHLQSEVYRESIQQHMLPGQNADVRARLQHPLQHHPSARGRGCVDGCAEGSRTPHARGLHEGFGRAGLARSASGRHRQRSRHWTGLCARCRLHPRRRAGHHLQGRDGNRPVRRAGCVVRRRYRACEGCLRNAN